MKGDPHSVALEVVYSPRCSLVAGVDEVGRGALFGPLVAAAVALTEPGSQALTALGVTDSKRLTPQRRVNNWLSQFRLSRLPGRLG